MLRPVTALSLLVCLGVVEAAPLQAQPARSPLTSGVPDNKKIVLVVPKTSTGNAWLSLMRSGLVLDRIWPIQPRGEEWARAVGLQIEPASTDSTQVQRAALGPRLKEAKAKPAGEDLVALRLLYEEVEKLPLDRAEGRKQELFAVLLTWADRLLKAPKSADQAAELQRVLVLLALRQSTLANDAASAGDDRAIVNQQLGDIPGREELVSAYRAVKQRLEQQPSALLQLPTLPAGTALSVDGGTPFLVPVRHAKSSEPLGPWLRLVPGVHEVSFVFGFQQGRFRVGQRHTVRLEPKEAAQLPADPEVETNLHVAEQGAWWNEEADAAALSRLVFEQKWADGLWTVQRISPARVEVWVYTQNEQAPKVGVIEWPSSFEALDSASGSSQLGPVVYALGCSLTWGERCPVLQTMPGWELLDPPASGGGLHGLMRYGGPVAVEETPVYKKWWFWTIIGGAVVAAGAGAAAYVATQPTNQVVYQLNLVPR